MSKANRRGKETQGAALLVLGWAVFGFTGCQKSASEPPPPAQNTVTQTNVTPATQTNGTSAPQPPKPNPKTDRPTFDGDKAYAILKKQCDFGPRVLGTEPHAKTRDYLLAEMKKYADQTLTQEFKYHNMTVTNVVGVIYPAGATAPAKSPVVLMAHWDTRPIADGPFSSEGNKAPAYRYGAKGWNRTNPILGASDGASGVAVLLELARLLHTKKPPVGVILVLDDAEDYGDFTANGQKGDGTELGSRYFADHYSETPAYGKPAYGILLDMVGASNAIFPREVYPERNSGTARAVHELNDKVFFTAQGLGYGDVFLSDQMQEVGDDHLAVNEKGIPMIDIIHPLPFNNYQTSGYTYWHTLQDTPDKCNGKTLKIVGETVAEVLYRETPAK